MSKSFDEAAKVVAAELARRRPRDRACFLRELLAHAAAGLVMVEGEEKAAENVYRLADAVAARSSPPR